MYKNRFGISYQLPINHQYFLFQITFAQNTQPSWSCFQDLQPSWLSQNSKSLSTSYILFHLSVFEDRIIAIFSVANFVETEDVC